MITSLKINNIALIDESNINFGEGFNVLTGETGAGKSIIIDSLSFVLGARADKTLIKTGKDFAKVEVVFELSKINETIKNFFEALFMEPETTIIITRYFNIAGKNECRVNGELVTINMLKKLTNELVDIFGQHDNQILLDVKSHIKLIDEQSQNIFLLKEELKQKLARLKEINIEISSLGGEGKDKEKNIELISYEINEIEMANLQIGEETELDQKRKMFLNSEKLSNNLSDALNFLSSDEAGIISNIKNAVYSLSQIANISSNINELKDRLNSNIYELNDIIDNINEVYSSVDYSEDELNSLEERLDLIKNLKRKYGSTIENVIGYLNNAKNKLNNLLSSDEAIKKCNKEKSILLNEIFKICQNLTNERKNVGKQISLKIIQELAMLGISGAKFEVYFESDYSIENIEKVVTASGADNLEFLFSANAGIEVRPLNKIISGGEMSRFMLAFKCAVNLDNEVKTLVFDEIDAGIGGLIGLEIGKKMVNISKFNQVLCVTHLAQIACFCDTHFKIEKSTNNNYTSSSIILLNNSDIVIEIARMIGSKSESEYGKLNAQELIHDALKYKKL